MHTRLLRPQPRIEATLVGSARLGLGPTKVAAVALTSVGILHSDLRRELLAARGVVIVKVTRRNRSACHRSPRSMYTKSTTTEWEVNRGKRAVWQPYAASR